jgi:hypothetical protein
MLCSPKPCSIQILDTRCWRTLQLLPTPTLIRVRGLGAGPVACDTGSLVHEPHSKDLQANVIGFFAFE